MQQQQWLTDVRQINLFDCVGSMLHVPIRVSTFPLDDLTFVGFGDCGWGVRRD